MIYHLSRSTYSGEHVHTSQSAHPHDPILLVSVQKSSGGTYGVSLYMYPTVYSLFILSILFTLFYSFSPLYSLFTLPTILLHSTRRLSILSPSKEADSSGTPHPQHLIGPTDMTATRLVELVPFLPE